MRKRWTQLCGLWIAVILMQQTAFAGALKVNVEDINDTKGQVVVLIFDNSEGFMQPSEAVRKGYISPIQGSQGEVEFKDLESGEYAVFVYHDENKDDRFNVGFRGRPLEQFGFSGTFEKGHRPDFEQISFKYDAAEGKTLDVSLAHHK